jgi:hypothetical protein
MSLPLKTIRMLSLLAATTLPLCAQDYSEIVELDKLEVSADKERSFSLPLDAAPASASRLAPRTDQS